jgi:hypothetical protein
VLYVYAIADAGTEIEVPGLMGADVYAVNAGEVDVLVSEHDHIEPTADVDELWAHEAVVEAAGDSNRAVLPLRLGSVLADEEAVRAFVAERADELARGLDRVRGAVELGIRAAVAHDSPQGTEQVDDEERPGTAYLMNRLAQKRRGDEVLDLVHRPLSALAREHMRLDRTLDDPSSVRLAYLVDEAAIAPFQERVRDLEAELGNVSLACTGPWPPYSFAGERVE